MAFVWTLKRKGHISTPSLKPLSSPYPLFTAPHLTPTPCCCQVTLTAAGTSLNRSKVLLKAPAAGVAAGSNMIQTIFSDYAPNTFPNTLVSHTQHTQHTQHTHAHTLWSC